LRVVRQEIVDRDADADNPEGRFRERVIGVDRSPFLRWRHTRAPRRAVYTLFGSKEGLFVDALAHGVHGFRRLAVEHPARYRIAFQRILPGLRPGPELTAARERALESTRNLPEGGEERAWRDALATVVEGFRASGRRRHVPGG
jgi:AcrR family transcriptional regulator